MISQVTIENFKRFKAPTEFAWTPTADEELTERLSKLMDGYKG